jgi:hypothetical protein
VPDLGRPRVCPGQRHAVDDDGPADPGADGEEHEAGAAAARAEPGLGERRGPKVVAERDGDRQLPLDDRAQRHVPPADPGRPDREAGGLVDEAERGDADGRRPGEPRLGQLHDLARDREQRPHHGVRSRVGRGRFPQLDEGPRRAVEQRRLDRRPADVDTDDARAVGGHGAHRDGSGTMRAAFHGGPPERLGRQADAQCGRPLADHT